MKAKLTKKLVDELEAVPDKRRTIWDTQLPAFGLMVTPLGPRGGGVKSYIVQYRCGGRGAPTRRVTIGHHGWQWQPAPAREEAGAILRQVKQGIDPFEERRRNREQERTGTLERWAEQAAPSTTSTRPSAKPSLRNTPRRSRHAAGVPRNGR